MAYYSRSHYSLTTEEPFPALYGGYILASDGAGAAEAAAKAFAKVLVEAPAGVYGAGTYGGSSYGASALHVGDALLLSLAKALTDGACAADVRALHSDKPLADGAAADESPLKHFYKVLWEAPAGVYGLGVYGFSMYGTGGELVATDSLTKALNKPLADGATAAETIAKAVAKPLTDGATVADAAVKLVEKLLTDGVDIDDADLDVLILLILTLMTRSTTLTLKERP